MPFSLVLDFQMTMTLKAKKQMDSGEFSTDSHTLAKLLLSSCSLPAGQRTPSPTTFPPEMTNTLSASSLEFMPKAKILKKFLLD